MARKQITFDDLIRLAKSYNIDKNEMFISCANQYVLQTKIIDKIKNALEEDDLLVTKEYVKGRENVMANPLVKELPKHTDSANKTLSLMLDIVDKFGDKTMAKESKLVKLMNDE